MSEPFLSDRITVDPFPLEPSWLITAKSYLIGVVAELGVEA